jgi:hypothetical protein
MTTIIMAADEEAAREAAFNLGLPEWIYPHRPEHVHGLRFDLVVYVEGWRTSSTQSAELGTAVELRADTHDAERLEQPRTATMLTGLHDARNAQAALAAGRRTTAAAPFVSPEQAQFAALRPRPRSLWARITRKVLSGSLSHKERDGAP